MDSKPGKKFDESGAEEEKGSRKTKKQNLVG